MRVNERAFEIKRRTIMRVQARIGLPCSYTRADYRADERALLGSVARKRRLREKLEAQFTFACGETAHSSGRKMEAVA